MILLDVVFQEDFPLSSCLKPEGSNCLMMRRGRRRRRDRGICLWWWWWGGKGIKKTERTKKRALTGRVVWGGEEKSQEIKKSFCKAAFLLPQRATLPQWATLPRQSLVSRLAWKQLNWNIYLLNECGFGDVYLEVSGKTRVQKILESSKTVLCDGCIHWWNSGCILSFDQSLGDIWTI